MRGLLLLMLHAGAGAAGAGAAGAGAAGAGVVLIAPFDGASTVMATPHLSWMPAEGCPAVAIPPAGGPACAGYRVQIQRADPGQAPVVVLEGETPPIIARFVPATPLALGAHRWKVAALLAPGPVWSSWRSPTVAAPARTIDVSSTAGYREIQAAFARVSNASSVLVRFQPSPGRRVLNPEEEEGEDARGGPSRGGAAAEGAGTPPPTTTTVFATLTNCTDVVLDFNGAMLSFTQWLGFFAITDCSRVLVRNLTVDVEPLPYTALVVESVAADGSWFIGSVLPGHPSPIADPNLINTRPLGEVQDPVTGWTKRGVEEVWDYFSNVTAVPDSLGDGAAAAQRYQVWLQPEAVTGGKRGRASEGLEVGDVFTMGQRVGPAGFRVVGGEEVVFLDVTAHACVNECFTSAYSPKHAILGGGLVLQPGRFKAGNDGGHVGPRAAWVDI